MNKNFGYVMWMRYKFVHVISFCSGLGKPDKTPDQSKSGLRYKNTISRTPAAKADPQPLADLTAAQNRLSNVAPSMLSVPSPPQAAASSDGGGSESQPFSQAVDVNDTFDKLLQQSKVSH